MVRLNPLRMNYLEEFQRLIEDYNSGEISIEVFFEKLMQFSQSLGEEEQRGIAENLSEEELAVFDLLTKPRIELSDDEIKQVKSVARDLLDTIKAERLVLDWRKKQQTRAAVRQNIEIILDQLPPAYSTPVYARKCDLVYQHIFDSYYDSTASVYSRAV